MAAWQKMTWHIPPPHFAVGADGVLLVEKAQADQAGIQGKGVTFQAGAVNLHPLRALTLGTAP